MKKNKLFVAILAIGLAACTEDNGGLEPDSGNKKPIELISAEMIQPVSLSSRIVIGDVDKDGNYPVKWRADDPKTDADEADVIYVYDSKGNGARFVYNEDADGSKGVFTRNVTTEKGDTIGSDIYDIKNALCVTSSVALKSQMPKSIEDEFSYVHTLIFHRGAENLPMYGTLGEDNVLKFRQATGLLELNVPNLDDFLAMNPKEALAVKVVAYDENGTPRKIMSSKAKLVNIENTENVDVQLVEATAKDFAAIFVQKGVALDNMKLYCPLLTGNYSKIEFQIFDSSAWKEAYSEVAIWTPAVGQKVISIGKKIYPVGVTFVKKAEDSDNDENGAGIENGGNVIPPLLPEGDNDFDVK